MDYELTRRVLAAFEREVVQYVVFGGVASAGPALHARRAGKTGAPAPPPEPEP